jgi:hypothetical protein
VTPRTSLRFSTNLESSGRSSIVPGLVVHATREETVLVFATSLTRPPPGVEVDPVSTRPISCACTPSSSGASSRSLPAQRSRGGWSNGKLIKPGRVRLCPRGRLEPGQVRWLFVRTGQPRLARANAWHHHRWRAFGGVRAACGPPCPAVRLPVSACLHGCRTD